jgi:hypothetical protein
VSDKAFDAMAIAQITDALRGVVGPGTLACLEGSAALRGAAKYLRAACHSHQELFRTALALKMALSANFALYGDMSDRMMSLAADTLEPLTQPDELETWSVR